MKPAIRSGIACSAIALLLVTTAISAHAQTFTTLFSFSFTDGAFPMGALSQGLDGDLYGTTYAGGKAACYRGCGTVFKITPGGVLTTLHFFSTDTQNSPLVGLILGANGHLFGTTDTDSKGCCSGTFFEIDSAGTLTTPTGTSGIPFSEMIQAANGVFYVPAQDIPATIQAITCAGKTTIIPICSKQNCGSSGLPYQPVAGLVQGSDLLLYGTTAIGGVGDGTIYRMGYNGSQFTLLHTFGGPDGAGPYGGLVQASDGNFYGTTFQGGVTAQGTVFKMTPTGTVTTLYNFCSQINCADGENPMARLVQGTDGDLYGTTSAGGDASCRPGLGVVGCGTIFKITTTGVLTTLYNFHQSTLGDTATALVQHTNGDFYGVAQGSIGERVYGSVFKLSVGLGPFVKTVPTIGAVGGNVTILGTNLTGATGVSFNGTAATFTVVSATEIRAKVPAAATTGSVEITTPSGTLTSNVVFHVL